MLSVARARVLSLLLLCVAASPLRAQEPPVLREADRVRLAEAFHLAEALRDSIWPGWSATPLAVLLVTPEHEFLIRHPRPDATFRPLGHDALLGSPVYVRDRVFPPDLLASFPAVGGVPTVVIGQPEQTRKNSTAWVLTLLHEHFHQYQMGHPEYAPRVQALDLARGDSTAMWMLNSAFPYDSALVAERFTAAAGTLLDALETAHTPEFAASLGHFRTADERLRQALAPDDHRYLHFQLWQEGIARYTQLQVARLAAERHLPLPEFGALPDFTPYATEAGALERGIRSGTRAAALGRQRRVAFYPYGAATGLLLDLAAPDWKRRYFEQMPLLEGLLR